MNRASFRTRAVLCRGHGKACAQGLRRPFRNIPSPARCPVAVPRLKGNKGIFMKISVIGSGYVGLVTAACFAETGLDVWCMDMDEAKIADLRAGLCPIYEPGLPELLRRNAEEGRLHFSTSLAEVLSGSEAAFMAVGTPEGEDGSADIRYVRNAAHSVGRLMTGDLVVVVKSTVPVGTSAEVENILHEELDLRGADFCVDVASNPEFLKEGHAVNDFMVPDRVIVGAESERARALMAAIYRPFLHSEDCLLIMDRASSEQVHGKRHAGHAHFLHERHCQPLREGGRQCGHGAHGHRHGQAHRLKLSSGRVRLRRFLLSQGREGAHCHRRAARQFPFRAGSRGKGE